MKTKKTTINLTERELKRVISESVKHVLNEGIKFADPRYGTVSPEVAKKYGFRQEYTNVPPEGLELWGGELNGKSQTQLARELGIKDFPYWYADGRVRIVVDPNKKDTNTNDNGRIGVPEKRGNHKYDNELQRLMNELMDAVYGGDLNAIKPLFKQCYDLSVRITRLQNVKF